MIYQSEELSAINATELEFKVLQTYKLIDFIEKINQYGKVKIIRNKPGLNTIILNCINAMISILIEINLFQEVSIVEILDIAVIHKS